MPDSIFKRYYSPEPFTDRFASNAVGALDVIIPVVHTNELWGKNLISIYRDVPVNRLLISDGGCKDDSIDIVRHFPRVVVFDHHSIATLGYCLRKLIEAVETEWFAYLHSDVYLPDGWFDTMKKHQNEFEWFGCPQRMTALVEYQNIDRMHGDVRPYAGSQIGKKAAFAAGLHSIDDDYVYRQEDYVFADIVERAGFRHGRVDDAYHYHQMMHKESPWARQIKQVKVTMEWSREEDIRASTMQVKGIVKYLQPTTILTIEVESHISRLLDLKATTWPEMKAWIASVNPLWLHHVRPWRMRMIRMIEKARITWRKRRART